MRGAGRGTRWILLVGLLWATEAGGQTRPLPAPRAPRPAPLDLLIRGGQVIDGTGAAARVADVGIVGDRIVLVGRSSASDPRPKRTIEAAGLVVAPGFVDPHAHVLEDLSAPERRGDAAFPL